MIVVEPLEQEVGHMPAEGDTPVEGNMAGVEVAEEHIQDCMQVLERVLYL